VLVCQCYAKLDELEQVNVASQGLVMIVGGAFKGPDWPGYDPGKFSILQQVRRSNREKGGGRQAAMRVSECKRSLSRHVSDASVYERRPTIAT
jgi:hypothetical protein